MRYKLPFLLLAFAIVISLLRFTLGADVSWWLSVAFLSLANAAYYRSWKYREPLPVIPYQTLFPKTFVKDLSDDIAEARTRDYRVVGTGKLKEGLAPRWHVSNPAIIFKKEKATKNCYSGITTKRIDAITFPSIVGGAEAVIGNGLIRDAVIKVD